MDRDKIRLAIAALKGFLWKGAIVVFVAGVVSFFFSRQLLVFLLKTTNMKVYYLSLPEALLASVQVALYAGIFFSVPVLLTLAWHEFRGAFGARPPRGYIYVFFAVLLFYLGGLFCCFIVLPSGIQFLLSYGSQTITPMISVERFVIFATAMIFAFGITFEVPMILMALGRIGIVRSRQLTRTRRFAVLFIVIAAAMITPTPDVYNMMLLAAPTYVLYEIGILLMRMSEKRRGL